MWNQVIFPTFDGSFQPEVSSKERGNPRKYLTFFLIYHYFYRSVLFYFSDTAFMQKFQQLCSLVSFRCPFLVSSPESRRAPRNKNDCLLIFTSLFVLLWMISSFSDARSGLIAPDSLRPASASDPTPLSTSQVDGVKSRSPYEHHSPSPQLLAQGSDRFQQQLPMNSVRPSRFDAAPSTSHSSQLDIFNHGPNLARSSTYFFSSSKPNHAN